jgi:hypothetical protein
MTGAVPAAFGEEPVSGQVLRQQDSQAGPAVGELDDLGGAQGSLPASAGGDHVRQLSFSDELAAQGGVGGHDAGLEAERPRQVDHGSGRSIECR